MKIPEMINVDSSNVNSIGYDESSQELYVRFNSGGLYVYRNVPEYEYNSLKTASSIGSYLHKFIKSQYPYECIER